jgi:hypothetical protein
MRTLNESVETIVRTDGIFLYKVYELEISYDDEISGAYDEAKEALKNRILNLKNKAVWTEKSRRKLLFAGRVTLAKPEYGDIEFSIDGIIIIDPYFKSFQFGKGISYEKTASYLNAIESHGLDYFLENYKSNLKEFATKLEFELKEEIEKFEQSGSTDDRKKSKLELGKFYLKDMWSILFLVQIHLPLGIENEQLIHAYEQIKDFAS